MKSILITLPCSLVVALFVTKFGLATLGLPTDSRWLLGGVVICTFLLYRRGLVELALIGAIATVAQLNANGIGSQLVSADMLLALLLSVLLLPTILRLFGIEMDLSRTR